MRFYKAKSIVSYIILFLAFFVLSCYIVNLGDDWVLKDGIERYKSFFGWAKFFFHNWGGRVIPLGVLVLLLQMPELVFHLVDAFAWVLLLNYMKRIFDSDNRISNNVFFFVIPLMIFVLIPASILNGTVFWKCANVLYLWGSATLLIAIYPFIRQIQGRRIETIDYVLSFIAILYTSSFEQAGVLLCVVCIVITMYSFYINYLNWKIVFLLLLTLASTIFFVKSPGNDVRIYAETIGWLQNYGMYSFVEKIVWGIWYFITNIEKNGAFIVLILASTVTYIMHFNRPRKDPVLICAYVMLSYFTICTLNQVGLTNSEKGYFISDIFKFWTVDSQEFDLSLSLAILSIIHFIAYVYLGCCILTIISSELEIIGFAFYLGAIATMCIMGFSPTVYASGSRPHFLCCLFFICIEIRLISLALLKHNYNRVETI